MRSEVLLSRRMQIQWQTNKMLVINTNHCRSELDTVQYVIDKSGYRETANPGEGDILWYGLALRDHDIDVIRARNQVYVNRYPLMDVSRFSVRGIAFCKKECTMCNIKQTLKILSRGLCIYPGIVSIAR